MPRVANVYRDEKRGTWYFVASLGTDERGRRVRRVRRGFKTQADAKAAYDRCIAEHRKGASRPDSSMTYGEFFRTYWLPDYRGRVRPSTFHTRSAMMRKHFALFDRVRLCDLSAPMLKRWQNELSGAGYSNGYVRLVFGCFQMSLDLACKLGLLRSNVARKVGNVRKVNKRMGFWTRDEFERVAATFDTSDYYQLFAYTSIWVLYMTGLRLGEFGALEWGKGLDLDGRTLTVAGSMWRRTATDWEVTQPKTRASNRTIALDSGTVERLRRWHEVQSANCPSRFVYSYDGTPASKHTLAHVIERHAAMAGVHRIRVHDLRHSHASLLISLGENALAIRDRLGHDNVETTLGTYGHLFDNANFAVAERLDAAGIGEGGGVGGE